MTRAPNFNEQHPQPAGDITAHRFHHTLIQTIDTAKLMTPTKYRGINQR